MNVFATFDKGASSLLHFEYEGGDLTARWLLRSKKNMNIIIGITVIAIAVYMKLKYRPKGAREMELFVMSIMAGIISILTIESYATFWQMLWPVIDVALCAALLGIYRVEINRQLARREARREEARRAQARAAAQASYQARMLSRASVIAMCQSSEQTPAAERMAA